MRVVAAAVLVGLLVPGAVSAQAPQPLTGTFHLGGETVIDPPPGEPRDTRLYVTVEGAAAKTLFARMRAEEYIDECTGTRSKIDQSGLWCFEDPAAGGFSCIFSIDLVNGGLSYGASAC